MDNRTTSTFLSIKSAARPAAKSYSVMNVRPTDKGGFSTCSNINNFGQVVGHGCDTAKAETRAFAWTLEHGLVPDLGSVYGRSSFATSLNDKGVVVGYVATVNDSLRAFLLGQGSMFDLGLISPLEYDEAFSVATDINEEGQVSGYSHNAANDVHAFIWDHRTGMIDLGALGKGRSYAYALNDAGTAVGWSQVDQPCGYRAFVWTSETDMTELPFERDIPTVAYGINGRGDISGAAATGLLKNTLEAVLWSAGGTIELGTLYGMAFSSGYSVNSAQQVVGWAYPKAQCDLHLGRAFVWDSVQGLQDLNHLIPRDSHWILNKATAINDDGEIVGCGTFEGKQQSFLLTPDDYARDVTRHIDVQQLNFINNNKTGAIYRTIIVKNATHRTIKGPLQLIFKGLPAGAKVFGASGEFDGAPIKTLQTELLAPASKMSTTVQFTGVPTATVDYEVECYAGNFA